MWFYDARKHSGGYGAKGWCSYHRERLDMQYREADLHLARAPISVGWSADEMLRQVGAPTDWRAVSAADAATTWCELREWVEWFKDRYALDHRAVPPCWYLHTALVDVLTALHDHHGYAFTELQPATAATEWHQVFRDLESRLRDWASRTGCTRDEHRSDVKLEWPNDDARWKQHLADDQHRRAAREQTQILDGCNVIAPGARSAEHGQLHRHRDAACGDQ